MKLKKKKVGKIFTKSSPQEIKEFTKIFNRYSKMFGITKEVHLNFFLAQLREEVGTSLKPRRENMNYSCKALTSIFRYYKNHPKEAFRDGRCKNHKAKRVQIANKVYANRIGNIELGDGNRYRGGGYLQLTGRSNYEMAADVINSLLGTTYTSENIESDINTIKGSLLTAFAFWYKNKIYNCIHIDCVTKKINRYTTSYVKRKKHYQYIASL